MKLKNFFLASLAAGLFASCSNDVLTPDDGGTILEGETTSYVTISICGDANNTRAAEYEYGSGDESMIKTVFLTFFDAGRNFVGSTLVSVGEDNTVTVPNYDGAPSHTVERKVTFVAQVDLPENINYPRYILAYVNPTSKAIADNFADLSSEKLEGVMNIIRERNTVSADGYRTMNNSVYFDETTGYSRFATEVDFKSQFFKTKELAEKAAKEDDDVLIDIYVERMEAKVRVSSSKSSSIDDIDVTSVSSNSGVNAGTKYKLEFVPEAWFVNATEKRSFLIKNFRSNQNNYTSSINGSTDLGRSFLDIQNAFENTIAGDNRKNEFNSFTNKRSFWAIDPTYFYSTSGDPYPDISFDIRYIWGNDKDINSDVNGANSNFPLLYRSYENVLDGYGTSNNYEIFSKSGAKTHEYILENTMSLQTLKGGDAKASMSSVVLLGYYTITDTKTGNTVFNGKTVNGKPDTDQAFYVRHEGDGSTYNVMVTDKEAKNFFMERSGSLFFVQGRDKDGELLFETDEKGEPILVDGKKVGIYVPLRAAHLSTETSNGIDYGVTHADFDLIYPTTDITNGKKQSEQWRTLTVKLTNGKANDNIYVYDSESNNYKPYNKVLENKAETELFADKMYSSFGVIEKFQAGKAYFNVPLKHLFYNPQAYADGEGNTNSNSNVFDAENVLLGDYGVVRNHIYDLTINKITGLGTGIGDITQPIVPPTENEKYYINARLNILQWRVVKQSVDL